MEIEYYTQESTQDFFQISSDQFLMQSDCSTKNDYNLQYYQDASQSQQHISSSTINTQQQIPFQYFENIEQKTLNQKQKKQQVQSSNQNQINDIMIAKPFLIIERNNSQEVQRPITEDRFFHIAGDILIDLSDEEPLDFGGRQKQIYEIIKQDKNIKFSLKPTKITNDIKYIVHLLDKSQDQQKHQLAQRIKKYSVITQGFQFIIKNIKQTYSQELDKLHFISQQREIYKQKFISDYIKQNFTQNDYFIIASNGVNFDTENITIKNIQIGYPVSQIIGLKDDNISYFALRTGVLDYCNNKSRQQFFNIFMDSFSQIRKSAVIIKDFHVTTIDGLTVVCDASFENILCNFPSDLLYHSNYPVPAELEVVFVVKLQISNSHIQHLDTLRQQMKNEHITKKRYSQTTPHYGKEDLQYSLETQIFMERFYSHLYKEFEQVQQINANEERQMQRGECGYRVIR